VRWLNGLPSFWKDDLPANQPMDTATFMNTAPATLCRTSAADRLRAGHKVAILTGGGDKPYALGIAGALKGQKVRFDFIASDELAVPEVLENPFARVLNLRGNQDPKAGGIAKMARVLIYYVKLLAYAPASRPKIFHLLWNNKFEWFDRTLLMLYYRLLGKALVLTAHNVNTKARDGRDSAFNRWTLGFQYRQADHIFVHTPKMKQEIEAGFNVRGSRISVIPFGINDTTPQTSLTSAQAKAKFGLAPEAKTILFFGNIAPYKGLEFLIEAFTRLSSSGEKIHLIIGGRKKCSPEYWQQIESLIAACPAKERIIQRFDFIPDEIVEEYFKASDVLVLPYTEIFQSGVLFLGYNFGLPVIASDVGSLREEIIEGETGHVCQPRDPADLAAKLGGYFSGALFRNLSQNRAKIRDYAAERYSWDKVAEITTAVYTKLVDS